MKKGYEMETYEIVKEGFVFVGLHSRQRDEPEHDMTWEQAEDHALALSGRWLEEVQIVQASSGQAEGLADWRDNSVV